MKKDNEAVNVAVNRAVNRATYWAVHWAIDDVANRDLQTDVYRAVELVVWWSGDRAVNLAVGNAGNVDPPHPSLQAYLREVL